MKTKNKNSKKLKLDIKDIDFKENYEFLKEVSEYLAKCFAVIIKYTFLGFFLFFTIITYLGLIFFIWIINLSKKLVENITKEDKR